MKKKLPKRNLTQCGATIVEYVILLAFLGLSIAITIRKGEIGQNASQSFMYASDGMGGGSLSTTSDDDTDDAGNGDDGW